MADQVTCGEPVPCEPVGCCCDCVPDSMTLVVLPLIGPGRVVAEYVWSETLQQFVPVMNRVEGAC